MTVRIVLARLILFALFAAVARSPIHAQPDLIGGSEEIKTPAVAATARADTEPPSEAELIAGLRKLLAADQQRLAELGEQLSLAEEDFERESDSFTELDRSLTEANAAVEAAADEAERIQSRERASEIQKEWEQARKRFDRIIARRKVIQEEQSLTRKTTELLRESLARREEMAPEESSSIEAEAAATPLAPARTSDAGEDAATVSGPGTRAEPAKRTGPLAIPGLSLPFSGTDEAVVPPPAAVVDEKLALVDERVLKARQAVETQRVELKSAQQALDEIDQASSTFERRLEIARRRLEIAREEAEAAAVDVQRGAEAAENLTAAGAGDDEVEAATAAVADDRARLQRAQEEIAEQTTQVSEWQTLLAQLQATRGEVIRRVEVADKNLTEDQTWLQFLEGPLAPHRIRDWFVHSAPRVIGVVLLMAVIWWLIRNVGNRFITALVSRSRQGTPAEREQRADTLRRVFLYVAGVTVLIVGVLAVLRASGIDVSVLLGGAAVLGAAIAFGSQNLIKDYFTGFMILAENQYSVGNVIRIADTAGVVEDISLRMTVLRDEEGTVHFIPHGQITKVSNLTHGWSRAVLRIAVGYKEDVDRVMEVLMDVAREMRDDEKFGPMMLGDPEMQGVDAFDESAVVVKILLKTRPLMQWNIKREMLRRVKKKFDQLGIEIPFPQRVVHQVTSGEEARRDRGPADRDRHKQLPPAQS